MIYYGHRYYSIDLERWINRDPVDEIGFKNSIVSEIDELLERKPLHKSGGNLYIFALNSGIQVMMLTFRMKGGY